MYLLLNLYAARAPAKGAEATANPDADMPPTVPPTQVAAPEPSDAGRPDGTA
jgi:hypothetical protein